MRTELLNKLSPEARESVIQMEARLAEIKIEKNEIDEQLNALDNQESLI